MMHSFSRHAVTVPREHPQMGADSFIPAGFDPVAEIRPAGFIDEHIAGGSAFPAGIDDHLPRPDTVVAQALEPVHWVITRSDDRGVAREVIHLAHEIDGRTENRVESRRDAKFLFHRRRLRQPRPEEIRVTDRTMAKKNAVIMHDPVRVILNV